MLASRALAALVALLGFHVLTVPASAGFAETLTLKKPNPASGAQFGYSLQVEGARAIVGALQDGIPAPDVGSAYVLDQDAYGIWQISAKLVASDGHGGQQFGYAVALSGNRAIAGAWNHSDGGQKAGAAYLFERSGAGVWSQIAKLTAADPQFGSNFGLAVALVGDRAVVGANLADGKGAVYVFERNAAGAWPQVAKLTSQDGTNNSLGRSVSLSGDRLVAGASGDSDFGTGAGAAYVFDRNASGTWVQTIKLHASDGTANDIFGERIVVEGDRVVVSAPNDAAFGQQTGACYVFERGFAGLWLQKAKLLPTTGSVLPGFGSGIDLDGDRLLVGARHFGATSIGEAYVFERDAVGTWNQTVLVTSADGDPFGAFGKSVAFAGEQLLVGASDDDLGRGTVHVFQVCGGSTTQYGAGCPGVGGFVPSLSMQGCLEDGAYTTLKVAGGLGGSTALLIFGAGPGNVPLGAGCSALVAPLLPLQLVVTLAGAGPGNGTLELTSGLPPGPIGSVTFTMQALVIDPSTPLGFCASNGLSITVD